MVSASLLD